VRTLLEILLWSSAALIAWTQLGYALLIAALARLLAPAPPASFSPRERTASPKKRQHAPGTVVNAAPRWLGCSRIRHDEQEAEQGKPTLPPVSLIVAAHDEQAVIGAKVANALALDYPPELFELIVVCDGCTDTTAQTAREAGADLVLELARGGKIVAQDAAVERARGEIVAFSDANAQWDPDALRELVGAFEDPHVGYACGRVRFIQASSAGARVQDARATNQEGLYWRYEMALRERESRLRSITAGNGAIYATRRDAYIVVDPIMGHDLSFPYNMVKRGWRAVDIPSARATEKMVPSIEGEWRRKRRMMSHTWPIVLRGGMLSPRGYTPGYALMILSHRLLRYLAPFLHAIALLANIALLLDGGGILYLLTLLVQASLYAAAALAPSLPARPLLIARYYVLTTASSAAGLWDWLRHGTAASWQAPEGTR
jgi:cellulose synthase/poly-beta-1,6-N-acetylglucosamine synthase-like glycosyltransferase